MANAQTVPQNPQLTPQIARVKNPSGADLIAVEMPGEGIVWRLNQFQSPIYTGTGAPTLTAPASPCKDALYLDTASGNVYLFSTTWTPIGSIPTVPLPQNTPAVLHQFLTSYNSATGAFGQAQPAAADVSGLAPSATTDTTNASNITSGTLPAARLPNPSATTLGGVESIAAVAHNFLTSISTSGIPAQAQPAASDLSNGVTGSGAVVLATSPALVTPTLGVASATSVNKVAITAPATSATLTIADGKTLKADNSLELAGTDNTVMTFPGSSDMVVGLAASQTLTNKTLTSPNLTTPAIGSGGATLAGSSSGTTTLKASATASGTLTLPAATDQLVGRATTDTLTNKTLTSPVVSNLQGANLRSQVFTSTGTFTIPAGITGVKVRVQGGGGAGAGSNGTVNGGGGGAGGYAETWLTGLTPGNTIAVTIGAGGAGASGAAGGNGVATSIASGTQSITTVSSPGGIGGFFSAATSPGGTNTGLPTGGAVNVGGAGGIMGTAGVGGGGGNSPFGGAGSNSNGSSGFAAVGWGSGGGASSAGGGTTAGGAGVGGIVIFEWIN